MSSPWHDVRGGCDEHWLTIVAVIPFYQLGTLRKQLGMLRTLCSSLFTSQAPRLFASSRSSNRPALSRPQLLLMAVGLLRVGKSVCLAWAPLARQQVAAVYCMKQSTSWCMASVVPGWHLWLRSPSQVSDGLHIAGRCAWGAAVTDSLVSMCASVQSFP
jgi:hypothetical protein